MVGHRIRAAKGRVRGKFSGQRMGGKLLRLPVTLSGQPNVIGRIQGAKAKVVAKGQSAKLRLQGARPGIIIPAARISSLNPPGGLAVLGERTVPARSYRPGLSVEI